MLCNARKRTQDTYRESASGFILLLALALLDVIINSVIHPLQMYLPISIVHELLTSSRRRTSIHAKIGCAADRRASLHTFRFLRVLAADLSTRHSWHDINLDDEYTRIYFLESTPPRLSGSEQLAQQTMNEFTLFVDICLIPLSNTCSFDVAAKDL